VRVHVRHAAALPRILYGTLNVPTVAKVKCRLRSVHADYSERHEWQAVACADKTCELSRR